MLDIVDAQCWTLSAILERERERGRERGRERDRERGRVRVLSCLVFVYVLREFVDICIDVGWRSSVSLQNNKYKLYTVRLYNEK